MVLVLLLLQVGTLIWYIYYINSCFYKSFFCVSSILCHLTVQPSIVPASWRLNQFCYILEPTCSSERTFKQYSLQHVWLLKHAKYSLLIGRHSDNLLNWIESFTRAQHAMQFCLHQFGSNDNVIVHSSLTSARNCHPASQKGFWALWLVCWYFMTMCEQVVICLVQIWSHYTLGACLI